MTRDRSGRKTLLSFLPHMPAFDSCFPVLERLHQRGHINVELAVGPWFKRREPRVLDVLAKSGVPCTHLSTLGLEVFSRGRIKRADAVLTHSDPIAYSKKSRLRDRYVKNLGKPCAFVQHGLFQWGLHYTRDEKRWEYYSDLMLVWEDLAPETLSVFADDYNARMVTTGALKVNRLPLSNLSKEFSALLDRYQRAVLICHNYGHEVRNFSDTAMAETFEALKTLAKDRPETLFVLRSHRGRGLERLDEATVALTESCANVVNTGRHDGLGQGATIHDILKRVDLVISHPSTVLLDASFAAKPVAVLDNYWDSLNDLPQIKGMHGFERYLDDPKTQALGHNLAKRLGSPEANLDRGAKAIESWIAKLA